MLNSNFQAVIFAGIFVTINGHTCKVNHSKTYLVMFNISRSACKECLAQGHNIVPPAMLETGKLDLKSST